MRVEFQKALVDGGNLEIVSHTLKNDAERIYKQKCRRIDDDFKAALLIQEGLKEDPNTQVYKLSKAYIDTYKNDHKSKDPEAKEQENIVELLKAEANTMDSQSHKKKVAK